jgi:hypothetical protein
LLCLLTNTCPFVFQILNNVFGLSLSFFHHGDEALEAIGFIGELVFLLSKLPSKILNFSQGLGKLVGLIGMDVLKSLEGGLGSVVILSE